MPPTSKCPLAHPHSCLSHGTYRYLIIRISRKKEAISPKIIIEIESVYKNMVFCHMKDKLIPYGPLTVDSYTFYCPSGLSQVSFQTSKS